MISDQEPSDAFGRLSFPENVSQTATTSDYWRLTSKMKEKIPAAQEERQKSAKHEELARRQVVRLAHSLHVKLRGEP